MDTKSIAGSEILCSLEYNLHPTEPRGQAFGRVCLTKDGLYVTSGDKVERKIELCEIDEIITDMGVGCVFCSYKNKSGDINLLCRCTLENSKSVIRAARRMNHYLEDGKIPANLTDYATKCPKCGRPYKSGSRICVHCADRRKLWTRTWRLFAPYKLLLFSAIFMFFVVSAINLYLPVVNRIAVDNYIQAPAGTKIDLTGFTVVILSMLLLQIAVRGVSMLRSHLLIAASNKLIVDLRNRLFDKIQRLSIARISERTAGDLMNRVTSDTSAVENFLINYLPSVIEQLAVFLAVGLYLFVYDARLFLLILLPTPFVVMSFNLFWKFMRVLFRKRWFSSARANSVLHDIFSGIRVVKAFGTEHRESERYREATDAERKMQEKTDCIWSVLMPILRYFICFGEFIILFYVGNKILGGEMTLGQMTQFSSYTGMIYGPLRMIAQIPRHFMRFSTSSAKVFEILDEPEDVADSKNPVDLKIKGDIDINNVSFGYDSGSEVLHKVDVHIKAGEFIGIVGASGAGKSTLINLIMRLYDVEDGSITVDGVDLRDISGESLRSQMGVVLQETFLFSGTVYQNIAYAKAGATRDEVIAVSKLSGCHEFITKMPDGYNTKVGERGSTLSGGERQRIAIARALLHNPKILILDEATASLDTETEKQIQDALARLSAERTTIAIAHRLSTLRNATRLVVLDKGRVAEVGTHDELIEKRGIYYSLVMAQREMSNMD
jgi:ATP-binding cassette subfamily B protein